MFKTTLNHAPDQPVHGQKPGSLWRRLALVGLALAGLTACASPQMPDGSPPDRPATGTDDEAVLDHVHGLGVDPADGQLYAASHFGVFRVEGDGSVARIADRWQDTMAFTVTGPNTFLGSGHPDLREDLPSHLGLIESTDTAKTWTPLSLQGEADFHVLEAAGPNLFGYDALSGKLLVTADRTTWTAVTTAQVTGLAWTGLDPEVVLAVTPMGLAEYRTDGRVRSLASAPPLVLIDSSRRGELVGITATGEVYSSSNPGSGKWMRADQTVPGAPEAFETTTDAWYAASNQGIYRSEDSGRSWIQIYEPD